LQGGPPGGQVLQPEDQPAERDVDREEQDRQHQEDLADRLGRLHARHRHAECLREISQDDATAGLRDRFQGGRVGAEVAVLGRVGDDQPGCRRMPDHAAGRLGDVQQVTPHLVGREIAFEASRAGRREGQRRVGQVRGHGAHGHGRARGGRRRHE